MSPHVLKSLAFVGVPATVIAGVADWYADGNGIDWLDGLVGTLAIAGATAWTAVAGIKREKEHRIAEANAAPAAAPAPPPPPPEPKRPDGEDALVLLAALQREARLVDFLKEDLSGYDDAQVGAAVRDVQRDAGKVLDRLFAPAPAVDAEEGTRLDPASQPAGRVTTTGAATAGPGTLVHAGWVATKVSLPARTGPADAAAARLIAPAEVEAG